MPTRNERKHAALMREIKSIEEKIAPLNRKQAYLEGELQLLNEYERAELEEAQGTLGINEQNKETE